MRSRRFYTDNAFYYQVYTHHGDLGESDLPGNWKKPGILDSIFGNVNKKSYPTMEDIFEARNIGNLDGIVLENFSAQDLSHNGDMYDFSASQYKLILENLKKSGMQVPLYFVDISVSDDYEKAYKAASLLGGGLLLAGVALEGNAISEMLQKKKDEEMTRRDFFRFMKKTTLSSGYTILGGYFLGGHLVWPYMLGYHRGVSGEVAPYMIYLNTEMFPTRTINLRNAVWARKVEECVAPRLKKKLGRKPLIAMVAGVMHAGLKQYLQDKKERDEVIEEYSHDLYKANLKELDYVLELMPTRGKGWKGRLIEHTLF